MRGGWPSTNDPVISAMQRESDGEKSALNDSGMNMETSWLQNAKYVRRNFSRRPKWQNVRRRLRFRQNGSLQKGISKIDISSFKSSSRKCHFSGRSLGPLSRETRAPGRPD